MTSTNVSIPAFSQIPLAWDQLEPIELGTMFFGAGVYFIGAFAILYIIYRRNWPPIKVLQPYVLAAAYVAAAIHWFSTLASLRLIPQTGPMLMCAFWGIWVWQAFGITVVATIIVFRFWRLHRIIVQRKPATGWFFWVMPFIIWLPSPFISIAASVNNGNGPVIANVSGTSTVYDICWLENSFLYAHIAHLVFLALTFFVLAFQLYQVKHRIYNEFPHVIATFLIVIIALVVYLFIVNNNLQFTAVGRAMNLFVFTLTINFTFWIFIIKPIFDSIFRKRAAEREFQQRKTGKIVTFGDPFSGGSGGGSGSQNSDRVTPERPMRSVRSEELAIQTFQGNARKISSQDDSPTKFGAL
jgi:hypothetical protein